MAQTNSLSQLEESWERAVERANEHTTQDAALGAMLTETAGLHVKSGVEAGGMWGTTSCTCEQTCECGPIG